MEPILSPAPQTTFEVSACCHVGAIVNEVNETSISPVDASERHPARHYPVGRGTSR